MNDQLYLLGWTTVIIFMTLVVKRLSHTDWGHQVYHRRLPLIKLFVTGKGWVIGFLPTLVLLYFYEQSAYSSYGFTLEFSVFIPLLCLPITWQLCTYEYNSFFNHWHWDLRISILVLNTLIFFHPAFLPAYLILLHFSNGQFTNGHGGYWTFSDKELPVFLLTCFCIFQFISLIISGPLFSSFTLSLITITAGHYTSAAIAKLRIGQYLSKANIHHMIASSFVVGWKLFKNEEALTKISRKLAPLSFLIAIAALAIELGGSFAIYQSEMLLTWLVIALGFHIIVYVISGIFFWKWVCTLVLLFYFFKSTDALVHFQGSPLALAYVVIMSVLLYYSRLVFRPGWITIPYAYQLHFWAHTVKGERFLLPPAFFKPYDMMFSQARFWFLSKKENHFASNVGSIAKANIHNSFQSITSPNQLADFRKKHGRLLYSLEKTKAFDSFVYTFITNKLSNKRHVTKILQPPRHLFYLGNLENYLDKKDPVQKVTIELEEYLFNENEILSNGKKLFHVINFDHNGLGDNLT